MVMLPRGVPRGVPPADGFIGHSEDYFMATVPRTMSYRPHAYPAEQLLPNGTLDSGGRVMRRDLVNTLGLKPRDLVALFSQQGRIGFDVNVREGSLVVATGKDGPAVIIGQEVAWICTRNGLFLEAGKEIQTRFAEIVGMAYKQDNQPTVPFALGVTEALLMQFLDRLKGRLQRALAESTPLLQSFKSPASEVNTVQLESLRRVKQRLDLLRAQAKAFQQALFNLIDDEEDMMALQTAAGAPREEWELCFEYYLQSGEEIGMEAAQQLESLEDLEGTISLRLSTRRLELEKVQLYLDVLGSGLSFGALLTGAFGMNLISGMEERRRMFWPVFGGIMLSCGAVCTAIRWLVLRRLQQPDGAFQWWRPGSQTRFAAQRRRLSALTEGAGAAPPPPPLSADELAAQRVN